MRTCVCLWSRWVQKQRCPKPLESNTAAAAAAWLSAAACHVLNPGKQLFNIGAPGPQTIALLSLLSPADRCSYIQHSFTAVIFV